MFGTEEDYNVRSLSAVPESQTLDFVTRPIDLSTLATARICVGLWEFLNQHRAYCSRFWRPKQPPLPVPVPEDYLPAVAKLAKHIDLFPGTKMTPYLWSYHVQYAFGDSEYERMRMSSFDFWQAADRYTRRAVDGMIRADSSSAVEA
jgi:hypothetical protein